MPDCKTCGAVESATSRIKKDKDYRKCLMVCATVIIVASIICGTVYGCYTVNRQQETIAEQQYALNMQYASLMDYISGAEITTETIDASDGGTAVKVDGDNNTTTTAGGDINYGENYDKEGQK